MTKKCSEDFLSCVIQFPAESRKAEAALKVGVIFLESALHIITSSWELRVQLPSLLSKAEVWLQ